MGSFLSSLTSKPKQGPEKDVEQRKSTLYALYEPATDPLTLTPQVYDNNCRWLEMRDVLNVRPKIAPSYSAIERSAVEVWRRQVHAIVTTRTSAYLPLTEDFSGLSSQSLSPVLQKNHTEHRLLRIPELLDLILHFAGPEAQICALNVSAVWRSSALSVIGCQKNTNAFRSLPPHPPVEYGQSIELDPIQPRPSAEEMKKFQKHLSGLIARRRNTSNQTYIYVPAEFTQLRDLPDDITQSLDELDLEQRHDIHARITSISRDTDVYWLDLSQVQINPYSNALFASENRIKHRLGRWEIDLRSPIASPGLITNQHLSTTLLLEAIGSMSVTNPPCKSLGIYHFDLDMQSSPGNNVLLTRVFNNDGVRVSELLDALTRVAPKVLMTWRHNANMLNENVAESHWIDNIWNVPGAPRVTIRLDNSQMPAADINFERLVEENGGFELAEAAAAARMGYAFHITRVAYMAAEPFRAEREGGWLPEELFEPMKSTTGRHQINWDT